MDAVTEALEEMRSKCPGWAYALVTKALRDARATTPEAPPTTPHRTAATVADLVGALTATGGPCHVRPAAVAKAATREAAGAGTLRAAVRWALDQPGSRGVEVSAGGATWQLAKEAALAEVAQVVPTWGPRGARVAFVAKHPTADDAAKGEPLCGDDGKVFGERYLAPLGLTKADVLITHLVPVAGDLDPVAAVQFDGFAAAELAAYKPTITVALGKAAATALGHRADFVMPHPAVFRGTGDNGECTRKLKAIRARLDGVQACKTDVHIIRKDSEKRIVIGVVLDGYQFDTQGDWVPPAEIEESAHEWMATSRVVGLQHSGPADAVVVESWLWPYPSPQDYQSAMAGLPHRAFAAKYGDDVVHSGSWLIGVRIEDDATWAAVQSGAITAYSIGGTGLQAPTAVSAMPEVEFIEA